MQRIETKIVYVKRIKIHPCVNEAHSRFFNREIRVFFFSSSLLFVFVWTIERKWKRTYENEQFCFGCVYLVSVQRTAPDADVDFTVFQCISFFHHISYIYAHTIHSLIIYEFFYFLLLLFAVRHTERRGLLKTCTHNWMRQSSAHRSWPLLLTKLLLLCWYLWNSDGFNNVFFFSLLSTLLSCCIGTYAIVVPWAARINVGGSI